MWMVFVHECLTRGNFPIACNQPRQPETKCVVVDEEEAQVTSANFTEAAQERNTEVGVLVRLPNFAKSLNEQFESLVNRGQLKRVPGI